MTLSGCTYFIIESDNMQQDGSYRIIATRVGLFPWLITSESDAAEQTAHTRANLLCKNGIENKSEFFLPERSSTTYQKTVMCKIKSAEK